MKDIIVELDVVDVDVMPVIGLNIPNEHQLIMNNAQNRLEK